MLVTCKVRTSSGGKLRSGYARALFLVRNFFVDVLWHSFAFSILLLVYLVVKLGVLILHKIPYCQRCALATERGCFEGSNFVSRIFGLNRKEGISQTELIELAFRNMRVKKTRTIVTVGGMMIGVGTVVFLVSIGYGIQKLVISRVAKLEEVRQADVVMQTGRKIKITDASLNEFSKLANVEDVLPLIAVVGHVTYNNSVSDAAVYGVQADYLKKSAMHPAHGKIFESNEIVGKIIEPNREEEAERLIGNVHQGEIKFTIKENEWVKVRESASAKSRLIGYTRRAGELQDGREVAGESYADSLAGSAARAEDGTTQGKWMNASVQLWEQATCTMANAGCEDGMYLPLKDDKQQQIVKEGYMAEINLHVVDTDNDGDDEAKNTAAAQGMELDEALEEALEEDEETETNQLVDLSISSRQEAVVNDAFLRVLGVPQEDAIGKQFSASFIVMGELLGSEKDKLQTNSAAYTIVGVLPEGSTPLAYVPFVDLRSLGINNYSQAKVVAENQEVLGQVRRQVEAMGYNTHSVVDTVAQINSFFDTTRLILGLIGMVALSVAALGMFNTLTVSLLERTREVGLLKAMGMRSTEVYDLFLTESMSMGFLGGVSGIFFGFAAGKAIGVLLSVVSASKGFGMIDVTSIPWSFVALIIFLSVVTGFITGIYPARRATKISALNALRYE